MDHTEVPPLQAPHSDNITDPATILHKCAQRNKISLISGCIIILTTLYFFTQFGTTASMGSAIFLLFVYLPLIAICTIICLTMLVLNIKALKYHHLKSSRTITLNIVGLILCLSPLIVYCGTLLLTSIDPYAAKINNLYDISQFQPKT